MTIPKPPATLSPASKKLWRETLTELGVDCRVPLDRTMLRRTLESLDRAEHYDRILAANDGLAVDNRGVPRRHPAAILGHQAHQAFVEGWRLLIAAWHTERRVRAAEGRPTAEEAVEHAALLELVRLPKSVRPGIRRGP